MADLVPVWRGSASLARRDELRPELQASSEAYSPIVSPFEEFDELWNRTVRGLFARSLTPGNWPQVWTPAVVLEETEEAWIFEVELPGAKREDVGVEVSERVLHISGRIAESERAGVVRHRARRTGSFEYRTTLPAGVDADKVDARLDKGLLTVRVPRPDRFRFHRVEII